MNIQAKLRCTHIIKHEFGAEEACLTAVSSDSPENKTFAEFTPNAHVAITITNKAALGAFVPGREYLLLFTPVPPKS